MKGWLGSSNNHPLMTCASLTNLQIPHGYLCHTPATLPSGPCCERQYPPAANVCTPRVTPWLPLPPPLQLSLQGRVVSGHISALKLVSDKAIAAGEFKVQMLLPPLQHSL